MIEEADVEAMDSGQTLRAALRQGLTTALKPRNSNALAALRTAMAAIDNAEAVPAPVTNSPTTSTHIAGARSGLGSTEATRRELSASELRDILRARSQSILAKPNATTHSATRMRPNGYAARHARSRHTWLTDLPDSAQSHGRAALLRPHDDGSAER